MLTNLNPFLSNNVVLQDFKGIPNKVGLIKLLHDKVLDSMTNSFKKGGNDVILNMHGEESHPRGIFSPMRVSLKPISLGGVRQYES